MAGTAIIGSGQIVLRPKHNYWDHYSTLLQDLSWGSLHRSCVRLVLRRTWWYSASNHACPPGTNMSSARARIHFALDPTLIVDSFVSLHIVAMPNQIEALFDPESSSKSTKRPLCSYHITFLVWISLALIPLMVDIIICGASIKTLKNESNHCKSRWNCELLPLIAWLESIDVDTDRNIRDKDETRQTIFGWSIVVSSCK